MGGLVPLVREPESRGLLRDGVQLPTMARRAIEEAWLIASLERLLWYYDDSALRGKTLLLLHDGSDSLKMGSMAFSVSEEARFVL